MFVFFECMQTLNCLVLNKNHARYGTEFAAKIWNLFKFKKDGNAHVRIGQCSNKYVALFRIGDWLFIKTNTLRMKWTTRVRLNILLKRKRDKPQTQRNHGEVSSTHNLNSAEVRTCSKAWNAHIFILLLICHVHLNSTRQEKFWMLDRNMLCNGQPEDLSQKQNT